MKGPEAKKNVSIKYEIDSNGRGGPLGVEFLQPNYDSESGFFWISVKNDSKVLKIKSFDIGLEGRNGGITIFDRGTEGIAKSDFSSSSNIAPVYLGDFIALIIPEEVSDSRPEFLKNLTGVGKLAKLASLKVESSQNQAREYLKKSGFQNTSFVTIPFVICATCVSPK